MQEEGHFYPLKFHRTAFTAVLSKWAHALKIDPLPSNLENFPFRKPQRLFTFGFERRLSQFTDHAAKVPKLHPTPRDPQIAPLRNRLPPPRLRSGWQQLRHTAEKFAYGWAKTSLPRSQRLCSMPTKCKFRRRSSRNWKFLVFFVRRRIGAEHSMPAFRNLRPRRGGARQLGPIDQSEKRFWAIDSYETHVDRKWLRGWKCQGFLQKWNSRWEFWTW